MGFRQIFPTFAILLLIISASGLHGQDSGHRGAPSAGDPLLEEARELAEGGKLQDAAVVYTRWLAENAGHEDFGMILIEAADSQLSIERALELLRAYTPRVEDAGQRELCRAAQIDLLEMLGRTEQALGLLRSFPPTPRWLYRQAQLLYQEGLAEEAEKSLEQALKALLSDEIGEIDAELEARIRLLQARIYAVQDRDREAENLFQLLSRKYGNTAVGPGIHLAYYEYLQARDRTEAAQEQLEKLARDFPDSPELALARSEDGQETIGYAPTPSRLLPRELPAAQEGGEVRPGRDQPESAEQPEAEQEAAAPQQQAAARTRVPAQSPAARAPATPPPATPAPATPPPIPTVLVQTGSFQDRENAEYMVRDLETHGFEAGIVEKKIAGTLYYRVVLGPPMIPDQAQAILMKLKDVGFEGVLLFPE